MRRAARLGALLAPVPALGACTAALGVPAPVVAYPIDRHRHVPVGSKVVVL